MRFGLRSMVLGVAVSAVCLAAWQRGGLGFGAAAVGTAILLIWGSRLERWRWRLVAWNWALALFVLSQLSSSYGWVLPLFGVVPGTPDDFVLRMRDITGIAIALIGGTVSLLSLAVGTFEQKLITLPPAMLLAPLLISFVVAVVF